MTSRYDFVQDPDSRRALAIVRAGAGATIVAALFGLSLMTAHQSPGASVSEEFGLQVVESEPATPMDARPADPIAAPDESAQPPRYMGEPAVY
jgi:hypothetical protein